MVGNVHGRFQMMCNSYGDVADADILMHLKWENSCFDVLSQCKHGSDIFKKMVV